MGKLEIGLPVVSIGGNHKFQPTVASASLHCFKAKADIAVFQAIQFHLAGRVFVQTRADQAGQVTKLALSGLAEQIVYAGPLGHRLVSLTA
jgi:hypothetical protein